MLLSVRQTAQLLSLRAACLQALMKTGEQQQLYTHCCFTHLPDGNVDDIQGEVCLLPKIRQSRVINRCPVEVVVQLFLRPHYKCHIPEKQPILGPAIYYVIRTDSKTLNSDG
jgi:hypothetical protein